MGAWASILTALVKVFELVTVAVKKARVQREEAAIKKNPTAWIGEHFSSGRNDDADGMRGDASTSHTEAKP